MIDKYLTGKIRYLTLFIAGGLSVLALAPFYFFPVLFATFPVFFKALESSVSRKQSFFTGWWFGFGYFVFGLYWIANSLLVDLRFAWLIPFSVAGIPFLLSIYIGILAIAYYVFSKRIQPNLVGKVFLLAVLWVIFEMMRGFFFTGFPWNLIGYAALASIPFAQLASIGGVSLLCFVVVVISLIPIYYKNYKFLLFVLVFIATSFGYGIYNVKYNFVAPTRPAADVIVFQPNIKQSLKWDPAIAKLQFIKDIDYIKSLDYKNKDIVLWPETGVPYYLNTQPVVEDILKEVSPDNGIMVTGALRSNGLQMPDYKVWNTLYAISKDGIYSHYDKMHLVPFGEFVPFRDVLPLDKITPGAVDFSRGESRDLIKFGDGPSFLSLICYEVIFPEYSFSPERPDLIVNVTNDGWFGNSTGPYQHLAMSQMRAIEQGLPLLRAANTGVSAIIDRNGRILASIPYDKHGSISQKVEITKTDTIFSKAGNLIILGLILTASLGILMFRKKH